MKKAFARGCFDGRSSFDTTMHFLALDTDRIYSRQDLIKSIFEQLKISLQSGKKIELRGFGTFENRMRKGRTKARNPKTGEIVSVDPHFVSVFRPGKEIKQAVWNLPVEVEEE